MKEVFQGLRTIKTGKEFEMYHGATDQVVTGLIAKSLEGYRLTYTRPFIEGLEVNADILLSVEPNLDKVDLENVNEILASEGFSFIKFR